MIQALKSSPRGCYLVESQRGRRGPASGPEARVSAVGGGPGLCQSPRVLSWCGGDGEWVWAKQSTQELCKVFIQRYLPADSRGSIDFWDILRECSLHRIFSIRIF